MNLLLALLHEHRQRTGHDCTNPRDRNQNCDVCIHLSYEFRERDKAIKEYYKNLESEQRELENKEKKCTAMRLKRKTSLPKRG